jgi:hypothetical protein
LGFPPSITATQLFVVPRSIPITFAMGMFVLVASFGALKRHAVR